MLKSIQGSIRTKLLLPIFLGCILLAVITVVLLQSVRQRNTELAGTTTASQVANEAFAFRDLYSSEILPRAKSYGAEADFNFAETENLLPLPATLLKTIGPKLAEDHPGTSVRYYSEYPFSYRVGTPEAELDEFDMAALAALQANPDEPFYRLETRDGVLSMRYVVADRMKESCVACHNTHPDSPRNDWQVGDVRGGLEIIVPVEAAQAGFNESGTLLTTLMIGSFLAVAGVVWLLLQIGVLKPLQTINRAVKEVEEGDLTARAIVNSEDEFGQLATGINNMLDVTTETIVGAQLKSEELQESIFGLLSEVSDVAEGDLTVRADVTDDELGPVADSFNFMLEQLRSVITDVKEATLQVSSSANEIQTTSEHLSLGSESQATQIVDTSAAIDEMSISIQQVSENAALSATVGAQARANAEKGAEAVRDTIEGMDRIRSQVEDTTKRIRRLGESSQRIGEIVELIDDIADRTSILALNAAIEADLAGEAGVSFAVVAEEVESLAERATQATQQITILIRNIQSEINEAIVAMEATTLDATNGSELASDAGERLQEIESVSDRLAELINSISLAAKQQARGSEAIARSMNEISEVTQQTAAGTKEATTSIGNLAMLADELRASVSTFKLPNSAEFDSAISFDEPELDYSDDFDSPSEASLEESYPLDLDPTDDDFDVDLD